MLQVLLDGMSSRVEVIDFFEMVSSNALVRAKPKRQPVAFCELAHKLISDAKIDSLSEVDSSCSLHVVSGHVPNGPMSSFPVQVVWKRSTINSEESVHAFV